VVSHDGIVLSACRNLDAVAAQVEVPLGLGSRYIAAANMSAVTNNRAHIGMFARKGLNKCGGHNSDKIRLRDVISRA
jgi:hypothetical protein